MYIRPAYLYVLSCINQLSQRKSALEHFLNAPVSRRSRRAAAPRVTVTSMAFTCGEGHTPSGSACVACLNSFKSSHKNVTCTPCPDNSFTNISAGVYTSVDACRCGPGFGPYDPQNIVEDVVEGVEEDAEGPNFRGNAGRRSLRGVKYWDARLQTCQRVIDEQTAKRVSSISSTVIASVIAVQVTTNIVTAVAASASSSLAASVAGSAGANTGAASAGGGSSGSSVSLITQVQFLSLTGRVGGQSGGSKSMQTFSSGFDWANYQLGFNFLEATVPPVTVRLPNQTNSSSNASNSSTRRSASDDDRRSKKDTAGSEGGADGNLTSKLNGTSGTDEVDCAWKTKTPAIETYMTCLCCLTLVFLLRSIVLSLLKNVVHRGNEKYKAPHALKFPQWEGPVLMTQILALTETSFSIIGM